ncbi:MAG: four helix bundle protein [Ignavibacteriales bacterium]|nr:four helix bundle protein [Ignavibacteriales bacterium]
MDSEELKSRSQDFAVEVIRFVMSLPNSRINHILGDQVLRSVTSVGANYRSACRARSKADFISKITIVEEECDETQYWLELFLRVGVPNKQLVERLLKEAAELTAIFTASGRTAKRNKY